MIEYTVKVHNSGRKYWFLNGQLHREYGPAVEQTDGYKAWFKHGDLHREDGPAIEHPNGSKYWFLNGKHLTKREWEKWMGKTLVYFSLLENMPENYSFNKIENLENIIKHDPSQYDNYNYEIYINEK